VHLIKLERDWKEGEMFTDELENHVCKKCGIEKPISAFEKEGNYRRHTCRKCRDERERELKKLKYLTDPVKKINIENKKTYIGDSDMIMGFTTIAISDLTLERLIKIRKKYKVSIVRLEKKYYLESFSDILERLLETSNADKSWSYQTTHLKGAKIADSKIKIKRQTHIKLRKLCKEFNITTNELVWRLIENCRKKQCL